MVRVAFALALSVALACASPPALSKPHKPPPAPAAGDNAAAAEHAAAPLPAAPAPPGDNAATAPHKCPGPAPVFTKKQKKCRVAHSCVCAGPCPACPGGAAGPPP